MNWRRDPSLSPLEGARGAGERQGEFGLGDFPAGTYPACSLHGAMNRVSTKNRLWRCLTEGCNVGCEQENK